MAKGHLDELQKAEVVSRSKLEPSVFIMYRIVTGKVVVPVDDILLPADSHTRSKHEHKYRHFNSTCEQYRHSFLYKLSLSGTCYLRPALKLIPQKLLRPHCAPPPHPPPPPPPVDVILQLEDCRLSILILIKTHYWINHRQNFYYRGGCYRQVSLYLYLECINSLRPSDAFMLWWTNHHWFR